MVPLSPPPRSTGMPSKCHCRMSRFVWGCFLFWLRSEHAKENTKIWLNDMQQDYCTQLLHTPTYLPTQQVLAHTHNSTGNGITHTHASGQEQQSKLRGEGAPKTRKTNKLANTFESFCHKCMRFDHAHSHTY